MRCHQCDNNRKSSDAYKKTRIEKRYHCIPAKTDNNYGPEAPTPSTSQGDLSCICNKYLLSLQITAQQASMFTEATINQDPSTNSLWQQ